MTGTPLLSAVTEYVLEAVVKIIDGDTFNARVSRSAGEIDGWDLTAAKVIRIRLVHLDTPERGEPGYHEAADDLEGWLNRGVEWTGLRVLAQDKKDSFGRFLSDVYESTDRAATASDYMVREANNGNGWPVWTPTKETHA